MFMYSQRCRFPPGSWVWTRLLLRLWVHPTVDPTKDWEGVGDAHIKNTPTAMEIGDHDGNSSPLAAVSQPKIHANALAAGAPPRTPLGELTVLPLTWHFQKRLT